VTLQAENYGYGYYRSGEFKQKYFVQSSGISRLCDCCDFSNFRPKPWSLRNNPFQTCHFFERHIMLQICRKLKLSVHDITSLFLQRISVICIPFTISLELFVFVHIQKYIVQFSPVFMWLLVISLVKLSNSQTETAGLYVCAK